MNNAKRKDGRSLPIGSQWYLMGKGVKVEVVSDGDMTYPLCKVIENTAVKTQFKVGDVKRMFCKILYPRKGKKAAAKK